jgi:hypothetical protein
MKADITDVLANLTRQANPELESRLECQAEVLAQTACIEPMIGEWIDSNDVIYLLEALTLEERDFAERFPRFGHLTIEQRQRWIVAIEAHLDRCVHCSLKRSYDLEFDARIERIYRSNRYVLLQLLDTDEDASLQPETRCVQKLSAITA